MVPIISIVGQSGSGKTTLIERIIPRLKAKGYKVGTIKHDAHHFEIDQKGKDTWRMMSAGADSVAISSRYKMAMIKLLEEEKSVDEISEWLFKDMDIVIAEGYKTADKPKIEVVRHDGIITNPKNNLIAIVFNTSEKEEIPSEKELSGIPSFLMDDLDLIADFIEERFLSKER